MKVRRDLLLFCAVAVVAVGSGWFLLANRPGAAIERFTSETKARAAASRQTPANSETFRATVCASSSCILVEAGGLAFIFGAGEGAARGLTELGLMRPDLDAAMLPDLEYETLAGLPDIARKSLANGRTKPLKVYGPSGLLPVIDGTNLMLSGDRAIRLEVGADGQDQGVEGQLVFDSGVVSIRAFGGQARGDSRVYRVDFEGKSLIIGGCASRTEHIVAAARGTQAASGVLAAGTSELLPGDHSDCVSITDVIRVAGESKFSDLLLAPTKPSATIPGAEAAWREIVAKEKGIAAIPAKTGFVLDLSGEKPTLRTSN